MLMRSMLSTVVIAALVLGSTVACRSDARARTDSVAMPAMPTMTGDSAHGAMGMSGVQGMHQDSIVPVVQAHLQRLATASPDSLTALVRADHQVVTALIADCETMMRDMKMTPPGKWHDAVRALRQDLDRMPGMTPAQLSAATPEHRKRIEGMLAMRHDMMKM